MSSSLHLLEKRSLIIRLLHEVSVRIWNGGKVSNMILAYCVKYLKQILNILPQRGLRTFDPFCIFPALFIHSFLIVPHNTELMTSYRAWCVSVSQSGREILTNFFSKIRLDEDYLKTDRSRKLPRENL